MQGWSDEDLNEAAAQLGFAFEDFIGAALCPIPDCYEHDWCACHQLCSHARIAYIEADQEELAQHMLPHHLLKARLPVSAKWGQSEILSMLHRL